MRPLKRIVGHIARTSSVQALGRWHRGNPLILMYHGVTRATPRGLLNCEGKHVELDRFVEQVRFVKRHRRVMSLDALVSGVVTGADMRGAVAITFDDGYENNVAHAAPALADLGVPASFFLATGYIDADRWMWVDRLEFALNHTARGALDPDGMGHVGLDENVRRCARSSGTPSSSRRRSCPGSSPRWTSSAASRPTRRAATIAS